MGLLSSTEVVECSVSDLVGQYVGHTGPKTKGVFEKALGKVLFIDEAYRLGEGRFAQEATDELVGLLTQPTFKGKLVVVLAGYEQDMQNLMSVNTGLSSRFPEHVVFRNMTAEQCMEVLEKELKKKSVNISGWHDESSEYMVEIKELLRDLAELPDWGNARDMMTLSKDMVGKALLQGGNAQESLKVSAKDALDVIKKMIEERQRRSRIPKKHRPISALPTQTHSLEPTPPPPTSVGTTASPATPTATPPTSPGRQANQRGGSLPNRGRGRGASRESNRGRGLGINNSRIGQPQQVQSPLPRTTNNEPDRQRDPRVSDGCDPEGPDTDQRDPGVSDALWNQLETAKRAAEASERRRIDDTNAARNRAAEQRKKEDEERRRLRELDRAVAEAEADRRVELERQRAEARRRAEAIRQARLRAEKELRDKQEAERRRKEQEEQVQRRLRQMGACPMGYRWIKMGNLYRCAGGAHSVSMNALGLQNSNT